jgi:hypothetical protein
VNRVVDPPVSQEPGTPTRRHFDVTFVRRVGLVVLGLQLLGLVVWSTVLADRFSLTRDFAVYHQSFWLIGHGQFDPIDTLQGFPFWQAHGEFLMWPLGLLGDLWPHPVTLLWLQDLAIVAAEAVALVWLCEIAGASRPGATSWLPPVLCVAGVVLLVADPWIYWSVSFDFHFEIIGLPFVLLTARALSRSPSSRATWWWVVLGLACGGVITTYLFCVGVAGVVAGKRWRRAGLLLVGISAGWLAVLAGLRADQAFFLAGGYGYLTVGAGQRAPTALSLGGLVRGVLTHPMNAARVLWDRRVDIYADVSSGGLLGVVLPWVLVPAVVAVLEGALYSKTYPGFIVPGYQVALLFVLVPVGTIWVLGVVGRRRSWVAVVLALVVVANTVAWGVVWIPRTAGRWLSVTRGAATVLASAARYIPAADEVIASQGVAGDLSGRRWMYTIGVPGSLPVHTSTVWVLVAPKQGPETVVASVSDAVIAELAGPLHARLVVHRSGVWVFRWRPAPDARLEVPAAAWTVAGWTVAGPAGTAHTTGPVAGWNAASSGRPGAVVAGDGWSLAKGRYRAEVDMSSSVAVVVQAWDVTAGRVLASRVVTPSLRRDTVSLFFGLARVERRHPDNGVGPFSTLQAPPPAGDDVEIRVRAPGGGTVDVYGVGVGRASG